MTGGRPAPGDRRTGRVIASRTRLVGALKVILPLGALVLLSTMFLISDRADPDAAIPYAEVDVADLARDPRLTSPTWAGTAADGSALTLRAGQAVPGADNAVTVQGLALKLETPQGLQADVLAGTGGVAADGARIDLTGGVRMNTSTGYSLETDSLRADTAASTLTSGGPVTAIAPFGKLTAGGLTLAPRPPAATAQTPDTPHAHVLDFTGGVRLIYLPAEVNHAP